MTIQKNIGLSLGLIGLLVLYLNSIPFFENTTLLFALCFLSMTLGGILYFKALYGSPLAGIKNDGGWFNALTSKGIWGWILGLVLTGFYIAIYWFPELLGYRTETASHTGFFLFHFDFSRCSNLNDCYTTSKFSNSFLKFFFIIITC